MATTVLAIAGMSCSGCVQSVQRKLSAMPGVREVQVDLASGTGRVLHDPEVTSPAALAAAVDTLGFTAKVTATEAAA